MACKDKSEFPPEARWIWAEPCSDLEAWWMFRGKVILPTAFTEARLRITAAFHYILYVNGTLVTRGPARSNNFRKAYDTVDLQSYLRPGTENVLAILAPTPKNTLDARPGPNPCAILAELSAKVAGVDRVVVATDGRWKCRRSEAFAPDSAGRAHAPELLLGREERFDARKESSGWTAPGFGDSSWDTACELGRWGWLRGLNWNQEQAPNGLLIFPMPAFKFRISFLDD